MLTIVDGRERNSILDEDRFAINAIVTSLMRSIWQRATLELSRW